MDGVIVTPWKVIGTSVTVSAAIATGGITILTNMLDDLRHEITERTKDRYYKSDAEAYHKLVDEKFNNVYFRFTYNEENIETCRIFIEQHRQAPHQGE